MTKDSRLERFLKALCSLDYSDLPTPLSRVEVLWSCLVTGETAPDFQPQSRTEKYLMSILGVYDLEDIPQPISRAEMLLYKLATGDTNVELEGGAKSRYEELLAEIVGKGEIGYTDFYYITHTLTDRLSTLYNTVEAPVKSAILKGNALVNHKKDNVVISPELSNCYDYTLSGCKNNTNYLIKFSAENDEDVMVGFLIDPSAWSTATTELKWAKPGNITVIINSGSTPNYLRIRAKSCENLMIIEYQDGMENCDIPYFEGIQSVKMPVLTTSNEGGTKTNILTVNEEVVLRGIGDVQDTLDLMTGEVVERVGEVIFDGSVDENWNLWATYPEESAIFRLSKENSLKLMKEFDKNGVFKCDKFSTVLKASIINSGNIHPHAISFFGSDGEYIQLRVYKSLLKSIDVDGLREYLANEQITVQYYLATEVVKTVDLSVVNQDGNNTKLSTFNDLTHVTLSSEGLIPEAELEVATKNEEVLNTMSLEMDDISTTQNALQEISNIQSENVDATMMATTEIYEQLL